MISDHLYDLFLQSSQTQGVFYRSIYIQGILMRDIWRIFRNYSTILMYGGRVVSFLSENFKLKLFSIMRGQAISIFEWNWKFILQIKIVMEEQNWYCTAERYHFGLRKLILLGKACVTPDVLWQRCLIEVSRGTCVDVRCFYERRRPSRAFTMIILWYWFFNA